MDKKDFLKICSKTADGYVSVSAFFAEADGFITYRTCTHVVVFENAAILCDEATFWRIKESGNRSFLCFGRLRSTPDTIDAFTEVCGVSMFFFAFMSEGDVLLFAKPAKVSGRGALGELVVDFTGQKCGIATRPDDSKPTLEMRIAERAQESARALPHAIPCALSTTPEGEKLREEHEQALKDLSRSLAA